VALSENITQMVADVGDSLEEQTVEKLSSARDLHMEQLHMLVMCREAHRKSQHWKDELNIHLEANREILMLERRLRYASQGILGSALPNIPASFQSLDFYRSRDEEMEMNNWRRGTGGRILWLMNNPPKQSSKLRYLGYEWETELDTQAHLLGKEYTFVIDEVPLSMEWMGIIQWVGPLTMYEVNCIDMLETYYADLVRERGILTGDQVDVREFTIPVTELQPSLSSSDVECAVCGQLCSDEDGEYFETAVQMRCGHLLGVKCLQRWFQESIVENKRPCPCPHCRSTVLDEIEAKIAYFPTGRMRKLARQYVDFFAHGRELDFQVDEILLQAKLDSEQCWDKSLEQLLFKLSRRYKKAITLHGRLNEAFYGEDDGLEPDENMEAELDYSGSEMAIDEDETMV